MSKFFFYGQPNNVDVQGNNARFENIYQKNHHTGEHERVLTAGDSPDPIALPYYLKNNSIDIDSGDNGSELTATALTFGDASGNTSIDKAKVGVLSDLKAGVVDAVDTASTNETIVSWNPVTKKFSKNPATTMLYSAALKGITFNRDTPSIVVQNSPNITTMTSSQFSITNGNSSTVTVGAGGAGGGYVIFSKLGNTSKYMYIEDAVVTNNLKALTNATIGSNSKMLIYDTSTRVFNYTDVPSGLVMPYYISSNKVNMVASDGLSGIILEPLNSSYSCISAENLTGTRPAYTRMYPNLLSFKQTASTTSYDMTHEDVKVTNQLKALGSMSKSSSTRPVIYNSTTGTYGYSTYNYASTTKWVAPTNSTWLSTNPSSISGGTLSGYSGVVYDFQTLQNPEDTLYIDLSTWNLPLTSVLGDRGIFFSCNAFDFTEDPVFEVTYSKSDVNITPSIIWVTNTGTPSYRCLFIRFNRISDTNINGFIKVTVKNPKTPVYPGIDLMTPGTYVL